MTKSARNFSRFQATLLSVLVASSVPSVALTAKTAHAQPAALSPEAEAREAMQTGIALFGRGDAEGALREYERAKRLVPAANQPYRYAAEALASLGRFREATDNLRTYLEKNPTVSDAEAVRKRIVELEAKASRGDLALRSTVVGARARVDDQETYELPHEFSLGAGEHTVTVEREGYVRLEQRVQVTAGKRAELLVSLVREATKLPDVPKPETRRERVGTIWPIVGGVGLGVGAATVIAGLIVDATALGTKLDAVDAAARVGDPGLLDVQSEARGLRTGVQVTYVAGLVTLVAGVAVLLLAPHHEYVETRPNTAQGPFTFHF